MTFGGLLLRLVLGYACGLLLGPLIGRYYSRPGDVSVRGGIAGGLGATVPYILLNSVWVGGLSHFVLTRHENWATFAIWLVAITLTEILGGRPRPAERNVALQSTGLVLQHSKRKAGKWLWLCAPAAIYSSWILLRVRPVTTSWLVYLVGLLAFIGILGHLLVLSISALRDPRT